MPPLFSIKGKNGKLSVYEYKIKISGRGLWGLLFHGLRGKKEIFFDQITAVKMRKGSLVNRGYLHFTFNEFHPQKNQFIKISDDENSILFSHKNNEEFEKAKLFIEEKISEFR